MKRHLLKQLVERAVILFSILTAVSLMPVSAQIPPGVKTVIQEVSFNTDDGWTLHATYYLPPEIGPTPIPGLVILSEPDWVPRSISDELALGVADIGMAALAIDVRGTDASFGSKDYQSFTREEREAVQLDVRAAVKFLTSRKEVDSNRIAAFGASDMVDYVAREAAENTDQIKALILSTGRLSDQGRAAIRFRKDLPILAFVSEDDPRERQEQAAEPYFLSQDKGSRLVFVMDRGASIFNRPGDPIKKTADWLKANLMAIGHQSQVSFKTEDEKLLQGRLYMPDGPDKGTKPVGGVVFIHGANHDATTWYHLAREVTKTGLASLIFDQRGYMKSVPNVRPYSFDIDTIQKDIRAAVNFLAAQSGVDAQRIALVTATSRGGPTVAAAYGDDRVRTIAALSFYGGTDTTNRYLTEMDIPLFLVASTNDVRADGRSLVDATREAYRLSNNKETELLIYDDAGRGSAMLKTKPELTGMLVRWISEKLAR
jgi:dipeptidyl aminopeptidase/acylaminoacyl peptidase